MFVDDNLFKGLFSFRNILNQKKKKKKKIKKTNLYKFLIIIKKK